MDLPLTSVQSSSAIHLADLRSTYSRPGASFQEVLRATASSDSPMRHIHSVRRGESLWEICRTALRVKGQDASNAAVHEAVKKIASANDLADPDTIQVGQQLDVSSLYPASIAQKSPHASSGLGGAASAPTLSGVSPLVPSASVVDMGVTASAKAHSSATDVTELLEKILDTPKAEANEAVAYTSPWQQVLGGSGRLTSSFGMRPDPFTGKVQQHDGIDLAADTGTEIRPLYAGRVVYSGWDGGYGRTVVVRHANGLETQYSHASKNLVEVGDTVTPETAIALVGSTGRSTGPHLHFEVHRQGRAVNPVPYLTGNGSKVAKVF